MKKEKTIFGRRKVLKLSGAALAGNAAIGTASAEQSQPENNRVSLEHAGVPKFVENKKIGFATGSPSKPVSVKAADSIQNTVLSNKPNEASAGRIKHDPVKEAKEYADRSSSEEKDIVGYGVSYTNGFPEIKISYSPRQIGGKKLQNQAQNLAETQVQNQAEVHQLEEQDARSRISEFVNQRKSQ